MRNAENHGLDYAHSFTNDDGFEEWLTCDSKGNDVHCYYNGTLEIHTKEPVCRFCETTMKKCGPKTWECPHCGKHRTYEGVIRAFDSIPNYTYGNHSTCDDYGEFMNHDATYVAGPNEYYYELTSMC